MLTDDQLAEITRRATRDKWDCDMDTLLQEVCALRAERARYKAALEEIVTWEESWTDECQGIRELRRVAREALRATKGGLSDAD